MFDKEIVSYLSYILSTRNSKALFTSKVEHLHHYDEEVISWQQKAGLAKYSSCPIVELPQPKVLESSLHETLCARSSQRSFSSSPLTNGEVSTLLHYGFGYNPMRPGRKFSPSSGGFHSPEAFIIALNTTNLPLGLYYYEAKQHALRSILLGNFGDWVSTDVFYQGDVARCAMVLVIASDLLRLSRKYHARAYRLALLDVGHAAQNVYLAAAAMNLKVCEALGYIENEVEEAFGLDGCEVPSITTLAIGK